MKCSDGDKKGDRMKEEIEHATLALVGLPLAPPGRAANMMMFGFGRLATRLNRHGKPVEVPEYALHVQCHWRIAEQHPRPRIVVGSRDVYSPADPTIDPEDENFHWDEPGANLCDRHMTSFIEQHVSCPLVVESIEADDIGSLRIRFTGGFTLDLFPDTSNNDRDDEHWCLFEPGHSDSFSHVTGYVPQS